MRHGAAGLLVNAIGSVAAVLADSVSFLVSAVCLTRIRVTERSVTAERERKTLMRRVLDGLVFLRHDPLLSWAKRRRAEWVKERYTWPLANCRQVMLKSQHSSSLFYGIGWH